MNSTFVPFCTILASARASQLVRRTLLADVLRVRRAVDPVAIAELDPGTANRIFGTGGDGEGLLRLHPLKLELRAVVVGGILGDRTDGAGPARSRSLLAANRCGVEVD